MGWALMEQLLVFEKLRTFGILHTPNYLVKDMSDQRFLEGLLGLLITFHSYNISFKESKPGDYLL